MTQTASETDRRRATAMRCIALRGRDRTNWQNAKSIPRTANCRQNNQQMTIRLRSHLGRIQSDDFQERKRKLKKKVVFSKSNSRMHFVEFADGQFHLQNNSTFEMDERKITVEWRTNDSESKQEIRRHPKARANGVCLTPTESQTIVLFSRKKWKDSCN